MTADAEAEAGLVTVAGNRPVRETIDRLRDAVTGAGYQVFARIDHADHAARAGLELRPTELLIFGKPEGGTHLMQDRQTAGIDLPMKALAWQDAAGEDLGDLQRRLVAHAAVTGSSRRATPVSRRSRRARWPRCARPPGPLPRAEGTGPVAMLPDRCVRGPRPLSRDDVYPSYSEG